MAFAWLVVLLLFASLNDGYHLSLATSVAPDAIYLERSDSAHGANVPHLAVRADDPDAIPPSPPWVDPGDIPYPPRCMFPLGSSTCPYSGDLVSSCTATKCTETFIGACMQHGELVDKSCFCTSLSADSCHGCSSDTQRAIFLGWLNTTCGDVSAWNGAMPTGWANSTALGPNMVPVGDFIESVNNDYFYDRPDYVNFVLSSDAWLDNLYNASSIVAVNASFGFVVSPLGYSPSRDGQIPFLDSHGFCSLIYENPPTKDRAQQAELLVWVSPICDNTTTGIHEFPENWKDSLPFGGPNFRRSDTFLASPECFNQTTCSMAKSQRNSTSEQCLPDPKFSSCSPLEMIDMPLFCKDCKSHGLS